MAFWAIGQCARIMAFGLGASALMKCPLWIHSAVVTLGLIWTANGGFRAMGFSAVRASAGLWFPPGSSPTECRLEYLAFHSAAA